MFSTFSLKHSPHSTARMKKTFHMCKRAIFRSRLRSSTQCDAKNCNHIIFQHLEYFKLPILQCTKYEQHQQYSSLSPVLIPRFNTNSFMPNRATASSEIMDCSKISTSSIHAFSFLFSLYSSVVVLDLSLTHIIYFILRIPQVWDSEHHAS